MLFKYLVFRGIFLYCVRIKKPPIKDASDRTLMYAVNYEDGYIIVSATKNYYPVLAEVDHGTYTGEKTGTGQDVLMNE